MERPKMINKVALWVVFTPMSRNDNMVKARNNSAIICVAEDVDVKKKDGKDMKKKVARKAILSSI